MRPIVTSVGPLASASATNIRTASGVLAAGAVVLNGALVSGGIAVLDAARRVLFTTSADETTKTVTLVGTSNSGASIGETVTLVNNTTVPSLLDYKTLISATVSAALTGNLSIGTNGVAASSWVYFDPWAPEGIAIQCTVSGTVNYTLQQTLDDPNSPTNAVLPAAVAWLPSSDTNVVAATANQQTNYNFTPAYGRVLLNSGTGTVTVTYIQNGVVVK